MSGSPVGFGQVCTFVTLTCLAVLSPAQAQTPRRVLPPAGATGLRTISQNWNNAEAEAFYELAQGSKVVHFDFFVNLEQPNSEGMFLDADHIRSFGYLPRAPLAGASYALPVGFVKDGVHLGLTCAACHTGQLVYQNTAYLIDGAPTMGDMEGFLRALVESMKATAADDAKFNRFADRVLGPTAGATERNDLRAQLKLELEQRKHYNARNMPGADSPKFGPGRLDAFGAILNEVSVTFAKVPTNQQPANAPVSYPFLWDTPQHDFVQWNGAAENSKLAIAKVLVGTEHVGALGRNTGEVMGVFGTVTVEKDVLLIPGRYRSSADLSKLTSVEELLRNLWSPQWPDEFPKIDADKKAKGEGLFNQHCVECHAPIVRDDKNRSVVAWLKHSVDTDPTMARNFVERRGKTGAFEGQLIQLPGVRRFGVEAGAGELLKHAVERVIITSSGAALPFRFHMSAPLELDLGGNKLFTRFQSIELKNNQFLAGIVNEKRNSVFRVAGASHTIDLSKLLPGSPAANDPLASLLDRLAPGSGPLEEGVAFRLKDSAPVGYIYKGRPLNGIWATAPYLHNGSVPNLDELLKKPGKRMTQFKVGSKEFDPVAVGFRTDVGSFSFDSTLPGNLNAGHDYGVEFTPEQRAQLIEYMKSL